MRKDPSSRRTNAFYTIVADLIMAIGLLAFLFVALRVAYESGTLGIGI